GRRKQSRVEDAESVQARRLPDREVPMLAEAARKVGKDDLVLEDPWRVDAQRQQEAQDDRDSHNRREPTPDRNGADVGGAALSQIARASFRIPSRRSLPQAHVNCASYERPVGSVDFTSRGEARGS